jgi:hypothetical protein
MIQSPMPLVHADTEKTEDAALAEEASAHLAKSPGLQLVAELLNKLRDSSLPWWTPQFTRETWGPGTRMTWLLARRDLRQKLTTALTGLAAKSARNKAPDFQANLIDSAIEDGDVSVEQFDDAFRAEDLVTYGPVVEFWQKFRERMPWSQDTLEHQELMAWLLDALMAPASTLEGCARKSILTPLAVRTSIPGKLWHTHIPIDVRIAIDEQRFQREKAKPGEPFHVIDDLSVATPAIIVANIPLRELARLLDHAERSMGFPVTPARPMTLPVGAMAPISVSMMAAKPAPPPSVPPAPGSSTNPVTLENLGLPEEKESFAFDDDEPDTGGAPEDRDGDSVPS